MSERLALLAPERAAEMTVATFHSFCWSILRERDHRLAGVVTPTRRRAVLEMIHPGAAPARIRSLAQDMERAWEGAEKPSAELRAVMDSYERELEGVGSIDIASLVGRLVAALQSDDDFRRSLCGRYRAIAVDELQDINPPQFELLRILTPDAESVLCIGDPEQAIYGFRGSDRQLFFRLRELTGSEAFSLGRNYRSAAGIVEAAASVISVDRALDGPALSAVRPPGEDIQVVQVSDPVEEGRWIAQQIRSLVGGVDSVSVDAARGGEGPGVRIRGLRGVVQDARGPRCPSPLPSGGWPAPVHRIERAAC